MTVYDASCHKQVSDCLKPNPDAERDQINSLSLVHLLLVSIKFSFICERQPCRVPIVPHLSNLMRDDSI